MVRGEIFNSVTHLVGSVFALAGLVGLLVTAGSTGDPWKITSFAVYGAALVALYLISTLYHSMTGRLKRILRKLDHTSIYVLIAGTYTPFALVSLRGPWGYVLFGIVWTLAVVGILQEFLVRRRIRAVSVSLYIVMGWLALAVFFPLRQAIGSTGMAWLFAGGIPRGREVRAQPRRLSPFRLGRKRGALLRCLTLRGLSPGAVGSKNGC